MYNYISCFFLLSWNIQQESNKSLSSSMSTLNHNFKVIHCSTGEWAQGCFSTFHHNFYHKMQNLSSFIFNTRPILPPTSMCHWHLRFTTLFWSGKIQKYTLFWNQEIMQSIVLYCIVLYCIVLYCIVLYCVALRCVALCCVVLYWRQRPYLCFTYLIKWFYYSILVLPCLSKRVSNVLLLLSV